MKQAMKEKTSSIKTGKPFLLIMPILIFFITMLSSCGGSPPSDFMKLPVGLEDSREWEIAFTKLSKEFKMEDIEVIKYVTIKKFVKILEAKNQEWEQLDNGNWKLKCSELNKETNEKQSLIVIFKPATLEGIDFAAIVYMGTPDMNVLDLMGGKGMYYKFGKKVLQKK